MTTTYDIETVLYQKLNSNSSLTSTLTGKIRKGERPADSTKEDIVINALGMPNTQLQIGIANVNIWVPDKKISENNVQENVADHARLKVLTDMVIGILDDVDSGNYDYDVQQQLPIEDPNGGSHGTNIRIKFYSININ